MRKATKLTPMVRFANVPTGQIGLGEMTMSEIEDTQHPNVEITVNNFGPITEANIDLRPLTDICRSRAILGKPILPRWCMPCMVLLTAYLLRVFYLLLEPRKGYGCNVVRTFIWSSDIPKEEEIREILNKLHYERFERSFKLSDLPKGIHVKNWALLPRETDFFREELQDELRELL